MRRWRVVEALPETVDLEARNPKGGPGDSASRKLDFSDFDRADPDELNRILWEALRPGTEMPAPVRSARLLWRWTSLALDRACGYYRAVVRPKHAFALSC